jgi:hypothetical protein
MATNVHYRLLTARGVALPLALCAGAFAALPFLSGLPLPNFGRAPAAPTPGAQRFTQEVFVPNVARGCRWQHSPDPAVQIADCGDENESVRVVFQNGHATEYRLIARQDPNRPPSTAQTSAPLSAVAGIVSNQQPSQPGRAIPSGSPPLRVTPGAGAPSSGAGG